MVSSSALRTSFRQLSTLSPKALRCPSNRGKTSRRRSMPGTKAPFGSAAIFLANQPGSVGNLLPQDDGSACLSDRRQVGGTKIASSAHEHCEPLARGRSLSAVQRVQRLVITHKLVLIPSSQPRIKLCLDPNSRKGSSRVFNNDLKVDVVGPRERHFLGTNDDCCRSRRVLRLDACQHPLREVAIRAHRGGEQRNRALLRLALVGLKVGPEDARRPRPCHRPNYLIGMPQ